MTDENKKIEKQLATASISTPLHALTLHLDLGFFKAERPPRISDIRIGEMRDTVVSKSFAVRFERFIVAVLQRLVKRLERLINLSAARESTSKRQR